MEGERCFQCAFTAEVERESGMHLCLADGQVYDRDHVCHMPTVEKKWEVCNYARQVKCFDKNIDMVRSAIKLMKDHNMEASQAMAAVKIIHGRYE